MKRRGELLAERFELMDDEEEVIEYRRWLPQWIRQGNVDEQRLWVRAMDRETGRSVVYSPPIPDAREVSSTIEQVAREVMALRLESVIPVLHVGPGIVYAEPWPVAPRPALGLAEAAACAATACEVVAHLQAIGDVELSFSPRHLRLAPHDGGFRVSWLIPVVPALARLDASARDNASTQNPLTDRDIEMLFGDEAPEPLSRSVTVSIAIQRNLVAFFFSLLGPDAAQPEGPLGASLRQIHDGTGWVADITALMRLFVGSVAAPETWTPRIAALPTLRAAPRRPRDWDAKITDLELAIAEWRAPVTALQLACAYHQRASRSFAAGDAHAALADVDRALVLDHSIGYQTTRAVLLDHIGQRTAARAEAADACMRAAALRLDSGSVAAFMDADDLVSHADYARALATAGLFAAHDGDLAAAERDLRRSLALQPTAAAAHALGSVLYRLGEVADAAEFEAQSVELEPTNARYRWALVVSLHRLGHTEEAHRHASEVLRREPDDSTHRARFARLFGG